MSILEFSSARPTAVPTRPMTRDRNFDGRLLAGKARRRARKGIVGQRITIGAIVAALAAVLAYGLLQL